MRKPARFSASGPELAATMPGRRKRRRVVLALLGGAAPAAALAWTAPAQPLAKKSGTWQANPDEQFLLEIAIRQMRIGDGARAYATPEGACIILPDLIASLDLPIRIDSGDGTARGWAFREENSIAIDRAKKTVTLRGVVEALGAENIRDTPEGWCVDAGVLGRWLGIDAKASTAGSMLLLKSEDKLPFELAKERRNRAANLMRKASFDLRTLPAVPLPYRLWRMPSVDFALNTGFIRDRRQGTQIERSGAMLAAGEIGGLSYETRAGTDMQGRLNLLRFRSYRSDPDGGLLGPLGATSVAAGDIDSFVSPLSPTSVSGRGAMVTNRPLSLLASFDRTSFVGELPGGWEAELYRNGQLLAFAGARADGRYRFDDVQLLYGENIFEIVTYGPQGQIRRRREVVSVGLEFVPPGKTWYWAGIVDPDRDLLGIRRHQGHGFGEQGLRLGIALEHGIDKRTSAGLAMQSMNLEGKRITWTEATLRRSLGSALLEVGAARDGGQGRAFRAQALAKLGPVNLSGQSLFTDNFRLPGSGTFARQEHRLSIDAPVKVGRGLLPLQGDLRYRLFQGGARQIEANARTSVQLERFNLAVAAKYLRNDSGVHSGRGDEWLLGVIGSGNIRRVRLRSSLDWRLGERSGLQRADVAAYWNAGDQADWEGAVGWDGDYRRARARVGYVRRFAGLAGNVSVEAASDGSVAAGLGLSFSLGSSGGRLRFSRQPLASGGNLQARVFRDLDGDGKRGPDEPLEPGAIITAGMRLAEMPTDTRGETMISGLENFRPIAIGIDTSSLNDPTLAAANTAQVIVPRPGVVAEVEVALVGGGSIEGALLKDGGTPFEGLDLELVDSAGKVIATTRSDFDGFYLFDRVPYGRYQVRLTAASAAVAQVPQQLHGELEVTGDQPSIRLGATRLTPAPSDG